METPTTNIIPSESKFIANKVKEEIIKIDSSATVILFGSRARGDAEHESDWDFLVLTQAEDFESMANKLRKTMLRQVELKHDVAISLIVKNKWVWQNRYNITNLYQSIKEEGILL